MNSFMPNNNSSTLNMTQKDQFNTTPSYLSSIPPSVIPNNDKPTTDLSSTPRKRTRATPEQLAVLEKTFNLNPSPNNRVREQLSRELGMSERSIQIWFQNRRAKVKNVAKKSSMLHDETLRMQYYASTAAAAACQAAVYRQQQQNGGPKDEKDMEDPVKSNPDLYYYYYYYYFNQQQQLQQRQKHTVYHPYAQQYQYPHSQYASSSSPSSSVPPPPISLKSMPPPPPPPPAASVTSLDENGSISPSDTMRSDPHGFWSKKQIHQQRARAHTIGPYPSSSFDLHRQQQRPKVFDRGASAELSSNKTHFMPPSSSSLNTAYPQQEPQENYTNMLNNLNTPTLPVSRSTAHSSLSPNQHQFANLSVNDRQDNTFLPYQSTPFFDQNQQQLAWTDLPFYEDPSLMITPTTSSMYNNQSPYEFTTTTSTTTTATAEHQYQKISAEALQIGTWKRMAFEPSDLLCQYDKTKKVFSWCIQDGLSRFKMEFPQEMIQKMKLTPLSSRPGWARLEISVVSTHQISFYMEVTPPQNWIQCRDYTEDKQASIVGLHQLDGPALALRAELDSLAKENQYLASIISQ